MTVHLCETVYNSELELNMQVLRLRARRTAAFMDEH